MDKYLGLAWVLTLLLRAIWIFIIPTITAIAAWKLWRSVPRWIPFAFLISAIISVAASIPEFLILLRRLSPQDYAKIAIPIAITLGAARIVAASALLTLAIKMKKMTEQGVAPYGAQRAPSGER